VTRVVADAEANTDRFAGLRRIGIDEISLRARPQVPHCRGGPRDRRVAVGPPRPGPEDTGEVLRLPR
jgi:hypothetical protein